MKYLILVAEYGNGHLAVGYAIEKMIDEEDEIMIVAPSTHEYTRLTTKANVYIYNNIVSKYTKNKLMKKTFSLAYNFTVDNKGLYYFVKSEGKNRTKKLIKNEEPDVIIETFPHAYKVGEKTLPVIVITDYTCSDMVIGEESSIYCVPAPFIKEGLIARGIEESKIHVTGIPVNEKFNIENKATTIRSVLITLGARGQIKTDDIEAIIDSCLLSGLIVTVVCGKNEEIKEVLSNYQNIMLYGFVDNMHELYEKADLIITKSGGISVSECIYSEKPMIVNVDQSLGGQETKNQEYIRLKNIGKVCKARDIPKMIEKLTTSDREYQLLLGNIKKAKKENYNKNIIEVIKKEKNS